MEWVVHNYWYFFGLGSAKMWCLHTSGAFSPFLSKRGIIRKKLYHHTPEAKWDCWAEKPTQTVRALLIVSTASSYFVVWTVKPPTLRNRNDIFLYECFYGTYPSYSYLCICGCLFFVHLPSLELPKLSPPVAKCNILEPICWWSRID